MRLTRVAFALAVLLSPAPALADCGDVHEAAPTATVAERQQETTPAAGCTADSKGCTEPQTSGDRQAVASTIADSRPDTAPRQ